MNRGFIAVALLMSLFGSAFAGDEVDYSAPYITLENGELVTKYPAKEHVPGADPAAPSSDIADETAPARSMPPWPIFVVTAIVFIAALLLQRSRRQQPRRQESTE